MDVLSLHLNLRKHRKCDAVILLAKRLDLILRAGLLSHKIVGRKAEDHKVIAAHFVVQGLQVFVLRGKPALAGYVYDHHYLVAVLAQGDVFTLDALHRELINGLVWGYASYHAEESQCEKK